MDIENAASSEIPSSCHKKKKRKRQDVGKNVEANNAFLEGTSSAKDTPLEPPIKTCKIEVLRNADAMMIEPPTNVILEKKTKKKKSKTRDDCKIISTDYKGASLESNASVNDTLLEPSIMAPTNVEDTTPEPLANAASGKKKRKKKKKKSKMGDDVIDDERISLENSALVDTTQEPPLDICTVVVATKAEAITLEPPAGVTSERKRKKKKSKIIDDFKMDATDHESASMDNIASAKDTTRELPLDTHTAAVTTEAEATALEPPASVTSEKKKKKKKSEIADDFKMNAIDQESASVEHSASVEDTTWEPPVNTNVVTVPTTAEATTLDSTNVNSKKKKKKKRSDDFKMNSTAHESALDALVKDTPLEPQVNICIAADPAKVEDVTTLEPSTDVTLEKKKQKKKRKASNDTKICAADHESAPLENSALVKDTSLEPAVHICTATIPTKAAEVTTLEPPTNVTLEETKKRKKNKASSDSIMDAVDHEGSSLENNASAKNTPVMPSVNFSVITIPREVDAMTLELPVDVASAKKKKKKKKKKSKTSNNSKPNAIDHESASMETTIFKGHLHQESVDGIDTVANPERCPSESLLSKELVVTSEKKKRKRSTSKDPTTYNIESENLNGATLEPIAIGTEQQNLELPSQIVNEKTTILENPTPHSDLGCSEEQTKERHRKKRTRKKKNKQAMRQNVHENNDKVLDGTIHPSFRSSVETEPQVKPECAQSGLSRKIIEEKEQKKFHALEIDDMDHALQQNVGLPSQDDFVTVSAGLNSTGIEEKGPSSEEQSILSNGVNNGSTKKSDGYTEVCDVPESQELETCKRRKKNYRTKVSKSSDSGDKLQPIEDKDNINTSSPCLVEENLSTSLDNQFQKTSSGIDDVSEQDADVLTERDSVSHLDNETESGEREELTKMSNREPGISNGVCEQQNGGMLVTRHDAFKGENRSCKENDSSDLSKLDAVKVELTREEAPLLSNYGEVEDVVHLDAFLKEGNIPLPNALPGRSLVVRSKKKLLILDVNGILVEFVSNVPKDCRPHIRISKKGVFKRPYCDDFLQFCFDRFNVAVWSSRLKCNMDKVVNFLFNQTKHKLLFCWDQSHCTPTGLNTIDNNSKPLVLKELRKVWEKVEPDLPFEKGEYDETNTLLLDDSPYKALRNPVNTAVFPFPYKFENEQDNSLGPGGDLRTYLEGLFMADNVREYVEQNPFGQGAITKSHKQWGFYCKIVSSDEPVSKL